MNNNLAATLCGNKRTITSLVVRLLVFKRKTTALNTLKLTIVLAFICIFTCKNNLVSAQTCTTNFLTNGSFENVVQPLIGNNLTGLFTHSLWTMTGGPFNVIKTNGTGYGGGPDNANDGTQYLDITNGAGTVTQQFTLVCTATDIDFSGFFSSRESAGAGYTNWTGSINIINAANVVVATSTVKNFVNADGAEDQIWYKVIGSATALPPGTYTFSANLGDYGNFDNAFLCVKPCSLLAIELHSFTAISKNCGAQLNWVTANEINLKNYEVQYSSDGILFTTVGTTKSNATNQYNFYHQPKNGQAFYRLKIVEMDGKFSYSKIVTLQTNCTNLKVNVYPTVVKNNFVVAVQNNNSTSLKLTVYDAVGKLIKMQNLTSAQTDIDIHTFTSGSYYVMVMGTNFTNQFKLIKL